MAGKTWRGAPSSGMVLALVVGLAGCSREAPYYAPSFSFKNSFATQHGGGSVVQADATWWTGFKDPVLNALIARALRDSISLELARERVAEAEASVRTIPTEASVTPSAGISRTKDVGATPQTDASATLSLNWLLDPYGQRREQIKAARARVEAADAEVDAARLLLLLNVSNAYIDLRYRQRALQIRQNEISSRRQTLTLTRTLFDQQSATRLDVVRTEARLAETEALIPGARAAIQTEKNRLAILLGASPGTLDINLDARAGQPRPALSPAVGIPADLLRNRPDIRIAERLYYATLSDVSAARADLYPRLSLGGAISLASIGDRDGSEYSFGPSVVLPALPGDSRRATVNLRESRARQANASWKSTVLDALFEVESALVDYSASSQAVSKSQNARRLYNEGVTLTRELVLQDNATIPELLEAEESTVDADLALADNMRLLARSYVSLNVSLGAGHADGAGGTPVTQ